MISEPREFGERFSTCTLNGFLYILGGVDIHGVAKNATHKYDPVTKMWSPMSYMIDGRDSAGKIINTF